MKCSVFLAQIRAGGGWQLPARGGDGCKRGLGRRAASTGQHGVNLGQPPVLALLCVLDIPPCARGAVSHLEERLSPLSLYSALLHMLG